MECCLVSITLSGFNVPVWDEPDRHEQTDELI
jgi:hypothetical protein